jgi:hypothetical protein
MMRRRIGSTRVLSGAPRMIIQSLRLRAGKIVFGDAKDFCNTIPPIADILGGAAEGYHSCWRVTLAHPTEIRTWSGFGFQVILLALHFSKLY